MISNAKISQSDAVLIVACVSVMPGGGREEFLNRQKAFSERVKKLWPEILEKEEKKKTSAEAKNKTIETRALTLDEFDKTVLSLGLIEILRLPNSNGTDFANCEKFADCCRIGKWFRDATSKKPIAPFAEPSDDELELGDPEPAARVKDPVEAPANHPEPA